MGPWRAAAYAACALALAGCADESPRNASPSADPSSSASGSAPTSTPALTPAPSTTAAAALDWMKVPGSVDDTVTRSTTWSLTTTDTDWHLAGPDSDVRSRAPGGWRIADALLDDEWSVVVLEDKAEQRPSRAEVVDLASGQRSTIDESSDVPTTGGGTWALGDGHVLHATVRRGAYCLATVDLATQRSQVAWCAPKRHGFSDAHVTSDSDSLLTFDSGRPSCRTVARLVGGAAQPFPGVEACTGWDGVADHGATVWSVVPREQEIEVADFHARTSDGVETDLGPGTSGSLTWCAGAAYFVRDPQRDGSPAALLRWSPTDGLSTAYETTGGQAFLEAPRCGGSAITITARTSRGDQQLTADLG